MTTADNNNTTAVLDESPTTVLPEAAQPHITQAHIVQPHIVQPETAQQDTAQPNGTFAITSFVLGIVSIVAGWSFVAPIVGLTLGVIALRRKSAERTLALWGVWLNGAMLAISVLVAVGFVSIMALGVFGGAFASSWGY